MGTVIQSAHIAASLSDTTGPQRSETQQQLAAVVSTYQPECPSCRTNVYVVEDAQRGANICRQCGIQIGGQLISEGSEWRSFADDGTSSHNDPSRVAGPDDEFFGLGTVFVGANGLSTRAQLGQTPEQRTLLNIIGVCRRMRLQLNLPESVLEEAQRIARVVVSAPAELRGKTIKTDSMGAACMFLAAGNKGVGVKKDVAQASASVSEKAMNKQLSRVKAILSKHDPLHVARTDSTLAPLHFVERYCNEWRLPPEIADAARAVITTAKRMDVAASALPANYAAAAIYFCVLLKELPTPLKTIAATCSATQDTLLKIARDLYNRRLAIVPKDFVDPLALERMRRP
jgi:transcription initiation factor TFIIB